MKKKVIFFVLAAIVAAVVSGLAYAYWVADANTTNNQIHTGAGEALSVAGLPIQVSGLKPITKPDPTAADAAYGAVNYFYVGNNGADPLMFYGYLANAATSGTSILPYVDIRVWLLGSATPSSAITNWTGFGSLGWVDSFQPAPGGPFLAYDGTIQNLCSAAYTLGNGSDPTVAPVTGAQAAGMNYLSSRGGGSSNASTWIDTPIAPGQNGVYRVAVWLDSSAPNSTQGQWASFDLDFHGVTTDGWAAGGYDLNPKQ